jgi:hypothetical protein
MTLPVPNMQAPLVGKDGRLLSPWNSFFQQLVQQAPDVSPVTDPSPFTANANGTVILTGAATVNLTRGNVIINLNGERIIPVRIGDTVSWTGAATVQFLGD